MPSSIDKTHALPDGTPGYETRDVHARGIYLFLLGLAVVIVGSALFSWGMFRLYGKIYPPQAPASPFAEGRQVPTGPILQVQPVEDFDHYMQREQQELNSYGWENRQTGAVRIPIDRAMDLLVQKGLPVAPAPGVPAPQKTPPPGNKKGLAP